MSEIISIKDAAFFSVPGVKQLMELLNCDGEEARIAGGAVRNALLGARVRDVDIATTATPDEVSRRCVAAGIRVVPTGIDHGTVSAIIGGIAYEITTLRQDIETDGRHAVVRFGRDWQQDANRRDFTINGLYADQSGAVIDLVGGVADIGTKTLRFIGDADERIGEDKLRVLRFFRFFAWYGQGRPDADGIRASARAKDKLNQLSAERVWAEFKRLLAAPDPSRALLWMRQAGVLTAILPESEKWGIDAIHALVKAEKTYDWDIDPMLRLAAIVPPHDARLIELSARLRLSKAESRRFLLWARAPSAASMQTEILLAVDLYRAEGQEIIDRIRLSLASALEKSDSKAIAAFQTQLTFALNWQRPQFPLSGSDLLDEGIPAGPDVGKRLKLLEERWVASGFALTKAQLMSF